MNKISATLLVFCLSVVMAYARGEGKVIQYQWKQNGEMVTLYADPELRAERVAEGKSGSPLMKPFVMEKRQGSLVFYRIDSKYARSMADAIQLLPVLRRGRGVHAPYDCIPIGNAIVSTHDIKGLRTWVERHGLTLKPSGVSDFWIVNTEPGEAALRVVGQLSRLPGVTTALPDCATSYTLR